MNIFLKKVAQPRKITALLIAFALLFTNVGIVHADSGSQEKVYYFLNDHLGNVDVVLDDQGNVVERADYLPYGNDRARITTDDTSGADDHKFTGKEHDDETGLYFYGARYYDPVIGRFVSPDPLSFDEAQSPEKRLKDTLTKPQLLNPYSYAANNPIRYNDPTGEFLGYVIDTLATFLLTPETAYAPDDPMNSDIASGKYQTERPDIVSTALAIATVNRTVEAVLNWGIGALAEYRASKALASKESDVMAGIQKSALERVKRRLWGMADRENPIGQIKAFGSRTKGTYRPDSDVDIYVETPNPDTPKNERIIRIKDSIKKDFKRETGRDLDLNMHPREDVGPITKFKKSDLKDF